MVSSAPDRTASPPRSRPTLGRLLWPLGLLIGGLVAIIAVLLLFAAREQNELAARASEHLARGALAAETDALANHARDYATWNDAVENLLITFDADWAEENIGLWAHDGLGMDATVVVDGSGTVIYGMIAGERLDGAVVAHFDGGLNELIATTRAAALQPGATEDAGLSAAAYLRLGGVVALAAAAPIVYTDGSLPNSGQAPAVLVYVRELSAPMLEAIARRYLFTDLRLAEAAAAPYEASLPLASAGGAVLGRLVWQPEKPGFATVRPLLLPGLILLPVVGFLLWLVVRHAQRTVRDLEASHRTLEDLTVSLAAARDRAQQQAAVEGELRDKAIAASRAKSEFLALVSHELRTPLNAILGFSETIATQVFGPMGGNRAVTDRYQDYARDIHESGSHLLSIINDILDLSKIEAGRYELHEEPVALDEVLSRCAALLRERALQRSLTLACGASDLRLQADPRALKQIVFNLLSNAIKFTDAGGRIELTAARGRESLEISVSDTGIGMSEEDLARATQPFGQAASSFTRSVGGTGLGLNVTQALIALHGGRLEIRSAPGKGTLAIVHLPLERLLPAETLKPAAPQPAA